MIGWILLLAAAIGCGHPTTPQTASPTSRTSEETTTVVPAVFDDLPEGRCGGFPALGESDPQPLLGGRLHVRGPGGAEDVPRPHSIMGAPEPTQMESRLFVEHGPNRFVVFAVELFRRPTGDLEEIVGELVPDGYTVARLDIAEPLEVVVAVPLELDTVDEAVELVRAYTVTPDGLVQQVTFYVTPAATDEAGCRRFALSLASSLTAGSRRLRDRAGPRVLGGTLGLTLPPDHQIVIQEGPDFTVYRIFPLLPLDGSSGSLGIYEGHHASFRPPDDATPVPGELFGNAMEWFEWEREGIRQRQALVPLSGHGQLHVFMGAEDDDVFDRLARAATTLTLTATPPPLPACPATPRLPDIEVPGFVRELPEVRTLSRADALSWLRTTYAEPEVATARAFDALGNHPRAREAFFHLATHATTSAGRLYGLAGLFFADRDAFDDTVCAVRGDLDGEVQVLTPCGRESRPVASLVESTDSDVVRGERHWQLRQWQIALHAGTPDLRGGGLSWRLALGGAGEGTIHETMWKLGGRGFVPAVTAGDGLAATLPPWQASPQRPRHTAITEMGGVCRVRADGRVACWGSTPASERRGLTLLPHPIAWPRELAVDLGLGCVLDEPGRRWCFALLETALSSRDEACPNTYPNPQQVVLRRFDDGPWQSLGTAADVCGIDDEDHLWCFANSTRYVPEWAELEGVGIGARYRVPIEGTVVGMAEGNALDGYAWTDTGEVVAWSDREEPHSIGRVENLSRLEVGYDYAKYAETTDGRVLAWGVAGDDPRQHHRAYGIDPGPHPWVEIADLRGWRLAAGDYHVCAVRDGTTRCWGSDSAAPLQPLIGEDRIDLPPTEHPAMRGATDLLAFYHTLCGVLPNGRLRCLGASLDALSNGRVDDDARGPITIDLDAIARRAH